VPVAVPGLAAARGAVPVLPVQGGQDDDDDSDVDMLTRSGQREVKKVLKTKGPGSLLQAVRLTIADYKVRYSRTATRAKQYSMLSPLGDHSPTTQRLIELRTTRKLKHKIVLH
jgi:hypothetical protein